jgi:hypothetical protein
MNFSIGPTKFSFGHPVQYLFYWALFTLLIRFLMSCQRITELSGWRHPGVSCKNACKNACKNLWRDFIGRSLNLKPRDYLVPMYIGTIELLIYPLLISLNAWQAVGGWIAIKTAAGWRWQTAGDAQGYMRFLLGNALVIFLSFLLAQMIHVN